MSNAGDVHPSDQLPSHRELLKFAATDREAAERLAPLLTDSLVTDNPYDRQAAEFIQYCVEEYGDLPGPNDWKVRIGELADGDDGRRQTLTKAVGRILFDTDLSGHNRDYLLDVAETTLLREAHLNAHSIVRGTPEGEVTEEMLLDLSEHLRGLEAGGQEEVPLYRWGDEVEEIEDHGEPVAPRLAWRGELTLLAGREKIAGKSTFAGAAAAAVTAGGSFLDGEGSRKGGTVLWWHEESPGRVKARIRDFGGETGEPHLALQERAPARDSVERLEEAAEEVEPDLVVVDSLTRLVVGRDLEASRSQDWAPVNDALARIARNRDAAVVVIHHAQKAGNEYRDSTEIGAGADMILNLTRTAGGLRTERKVSALGRWELDDYRVDLREGDPARFRLVGGGRDLEDHVFRFVAQNPDCSQREVRESVSGKGTRIVEALDALEASGKVRDHGSGRKSRYRPVGVKSP